MEVMYEYGVNKFLLYLNEADEAVHPSTNDDHDLGNQLMINITPPPPPPPPPAATKLHYQVPIFGGMLTDISIGDLQDFDNYIISLQSNAAAAMRKAKVLRYKWKKKRRNFMKKVRYPSRKAYAEIRPRMRGRFIKVSEPPGQTIESTQVSSLS